MSALQGGVAQLRAGDAESAAISLNHAIRIDANEPHAWIAEGVLLLETSNLRAARTSFSRALVLSPGDELAETGLALCDLAGGMTVSAHRHISSQTAHGSEAAARLNRYLEALPAGGAGIEQGAALSPRHWPITASYNPSHPLCLRWNPNPRLRPPAFPRDTVSGKITLVAPLAATLAMATFDIDGSPAGMTNVAPCSWTWNTAEWPDGWHLVRITGTRNRGGAVVRETWFQTANGLKNANPTGYDVRSIRATLDAAMTIFPDARYGHLSRARIALSAGRLAEARAELEDVVGEDPYFKDAAHLLRAMPEPPVPAEVWHGPRTSKRIALTFDDGPNPLRTPTLLDVLDTLKAPATFMVVGKQAALYPDIVRRMAATGYEVENHTWNHRNLRHLSDAQVLQELASTKRLVYELTGAPTRYFRPPGGNIGSAAHKAAKTLGMSAAMWTFASGKAEGMPIEDMVPRFIRAARPGAIFLIHNGTDKMEAMVGLVVKALRARGYEFVRLDQLVGGAAH
jgi:peptidoglycan/xylan/chitin deacetylase (PgdA/CDA1 family)